MALETVTTAPEALERYRYALDHNQLTQGKWHSTAGDGRWLACALGVIGDDIDDTATCPASVMPEWLAQTVPYFFDIQPFDDAKAWGLRFYTALAALNGDVPFRVYHRWMAEYVLPLAAKSARSIDGAQDAVAANETMIALHIRAANGDMPSEEERSAAKSAAKSAAWSVAEIAAEIAAESAAKSAAWSAAWSAAESAAKSAAESAAEIAAESAAKSAAWSAAWSAAESAAKSAAESAAKSAAEIAAEIAAESAAKNAAIKKLADGLVSALEAEAA